jgi:hypothetical protein
MGRIDLIDNPETKKDGDEDGVVSLSHINAMVHHHFVAADPLLEGSFLGTLRTIKERERQTSGSLRYQYHLYSENQEGIGKFDRETNPYLADMLMRQCYVGGCVASTLREVHKVDNVSHPGKTVKWGNSSCPVIAIKESHTKYQKRTIQGHNKTIRKSFFVHYVLNLLDRQGNAAMLAKLNGMTMDDRAHLCDSVTQGMRCLQTDLWLLLEKQSQQMYGGIRTTNLPRNTLPNDILERVLSQLHTLSFRDDTVPLEFKTVAKPTGIRKKSAAKPKRTSRLIVTK